MTNAEDWSGPVGERWAQEWRRTDRSFGQLTGHLLDLARRFGFDRVVDVGCGAGELSLALARDKLSADVRGIDISPFLIAAAQERGSRLRNVRFEQADAASWRPGDAHLKDMIISRHGVMFFAEPVSAFANLVQLAAPDGRLLFTCFRDRSANEWANIAAHLLGRPETVTDPSEPGPFAFADPEHVLAILTAAGWVDVGIEPYDYPMIAGSGQDALADAVSYFLAMGPTAVAARDLAGAELDSFTAKLHDHLTHFLNDNIVAMRASAWIVTAVRP